MTTEQAAQLIVAVDLVAKGLGWIGTAIIIAAFMHAFLAK
jgi:hypothetical protein